MKYFFFNLIMDGCERSWPTPPVTKVESVDKRKRPRAVHSAQCRGKWWRCCKISKEPTAIFSLPADLPVIWCFLVRWHSGPVRDRLGWVDMGWDGGREYVKMATVVICSGGKFLCAANAVHWFSDLQIFIDLLVEMPWSWSILITWSQHNIFILCDIDKVFICWYFQGLLRHHAGDATAWQPQPAQHLAL